MATLKIVILLLFLCGLCTSDARDIGNSKRRVKRDAPVYTITSVLSKPYLMYDEDPLTNTTNRGKLVGFVPDFMEALADHLDFKPQIRIVPDGKYGSKGPDGTWNGMIGEVASGRAQMAVADLTVTANRATVVDFTLPFFSTHLGIVTAAPQDGESVSKGTFFFLRAFSPEVWGCILVAFVVFSAVFFITNRTRKADDKKNSSATICESAWFTSSALFLQTSGYYPKSMTGRAASCVWWMFCLFFVALFVASLVSLLMAPGHTTYAKGSELLEDVVSKRNMDIGVMAHGSTRGFFESSTVSMYSRFNDYLNAHPDVMLKSYPEGLERITAAQGKYGMIMESLSADYLTNQMCEYIKIPGDLYVQRYYAIAMPQGAPYKKEFDKAILELNEMGTVDSLYHKWWHESKPTCPSRNSRGSGTLALGDMAGIFFILLIGLAILLIVAGVEYWFTKRNAEHENTV